MRRVFAVVSQDSPLDLSLLKWDYLFLHKLRTQLSIVLCGRQNTGDLFNYSNKICLFVYWGSDHSVSCQHNTFMDFVWSLFIWLLTYIASFIWRQICVLLSNVCKKYYSERQKQFFKVLTEPFIFFNQILHFRDKNVKHSNQKV